MGIDFFILMKSEMSLILIIFTLLILKVSETIKTNVVFLHVTNGLLLVNFILGFLLNKEGVLFNGMFHTNSVISLEKNLLNLGTLIISLQSFDWLKKHKHMPEFYILLLTTLLGMFYMISSNNLLMLYLGMELSTIPLAALANFEMEKIKSSESAVKLILSSAFASCITLFGISFIYGTTGSLDFFEIINNFTGSHLEILAFIALFTGFAFKLSTVPFHLWTADVYEGAPIPVTAYLSVISKGAIVFTFIPVLYKLFIDIESIWYNMIYLSIVLSIIVGNLFAIRQDNFKRFLAFSSIAQLGYILLGVSSASNSGATSAIYFLLVYIFSNLAVFGVISAVYVHSDKENISDYKGFYKTNPFLSWVLAIALFSLAGIPPTAGFFGKMFLVTSGASKGNYILTSIAAMNMVVSLYYYLKIVKTVFIDKNENPIPKTEGHPIVKLSLIICMIGIVLIGFFGNIYEYIYSLM